ncbi:hypothetical protein VP1G_08959 [Cytospora mali]|uniref:Acetyltransferase n=1 Tax=Cytospora mali TaxID=578113 RepID=A0A194VCS7_CYTMA|nr:hypothetical protein VP1G_08959 [Valsa mali var. pyri (nom. inval.)]
MFGRALLTLDAIGLLFGAWVADWGVTHQFNPRWPPHAKFHNAQTIGLSTTLGVATMFLTWRSLFLSTSRQLDRWSLQVAAFTGSIYWLTGLTAIYFPEADGLDPEFGGPGFPQRPLFITLAALGFIGSFLELR